jgi:uncharacterized protein YcfL
MTGQTRTLMAVAVAAFMLAGSATRAVAQTPAPRLQPALHGEAQIAMTNPVVVREGKNIVTTMKIKNLSKQPIAGFKLEEFWYDAKGTVVNGETFRYPKPLQPDEVIDVKLTDQVTGKEQRNNYKFSHANGTVKPTKVAKLP